MDLTAELSAIEQIVDLAGIDDVFVEAAASYGGLRGISYAVWREAGVDAAVLNELVFRARDFNRHDLSVAVPGRTETVQRCWRLRELVCGYGCEQR